jgi:DNA-binding LytR/AlgR family response regulator
MIHCIAIDDEPLALEVIKTLCSQISYLSLQQTFTKSSSAKRYLSNFPVDLIFLDIQMPDINGIDFYKEIVERQNTMVIFTTAYSEYAVEGFNVDAIDYLLKPITPERFEKAVEKAEAYISFKQNSDLQQQELYIRSNYALVRIAYTDILHCEAMEDYIKIHRKNATPILTLMRMNQLLDKLPSHLFTRIHRSHIIGLQHIVEVKKKKIRIGEKWIPIGQSYQDEFITHYTPYKEVFIDRKTFFGEFFLSLFSYKIPLHSKIKI